MRCKYLLSIMVTVALLAGTGVASPAASEVGGDFVLVDHNGRDYALHDARGKPVLLFFGYTSCPDVCPTSLLTVQTVLRRLGDRAPAVQALFVSVDPRRDTPAVLKNYLAYFDPSIIGLTGSSETLREVARRYRTFFRLKGDIASGRYAVDHGSNLYLIDRNGSVARIIPFGTPVDSIVDALRPLLDDEP